MRRALALVPVVLAAVGLVGCDCAGAPAGRRTVAVVPKGTSHVFWRSVHAGAAEAGRELDVEVLWQGPVREDDRAGQIRVVEDMIARRVDALALAPLDATALVPVAREATREGIPVVIFDSGIDWGDPVSFVATDNREGGVLAARRLGALLEGRGEVILVRYLEGSASTTRREEGFLATLAADFPDLEVVSSNQFGGPTADRAYRTAENLLVRHPDVDGIFTPNESTTFGALRALTDAGRVGDVKLVGFDANEPLVEALRDGRLHGLVVQDPVRMGDLAVRTALQHLDGETVAARIDTGATMVTAANMDEPAVARLLSPDLSILGPR